MEEIKEYSKKYNKYIKDKMLPYEDSNLRLSYYEGEWGYDEDYVEEHMANNNIKLTNNPKYQTK